MRFNLRYFYGGILAIVFVVAISLSAYRVVHQVERVSRAADFGGIFLNIEYATTDEARQRGLGGRESIPGDYGMLFVFPKSDRYGFWMKDTLVPLDIFWLDEGGKVVYMAQNVATSSYPAVFYPTVPGLYVLETVAGFAGAHGIATGTPLRLKNLPTVSK